MDQTMARLADGDAGGGGMSRADWIGAARALLVAEGIEAVKILRLADRLGVSRGSFYWHFTDRADLLEALLALWTRQNTRAVIDAADGALDLTAGILSLFDVWVDTERFDARLKRAARGGSVEAARFWIGIQFRRQYETGRQAAPLADDLADPLLGPAIAVEP